MGVSQEQISNVNGGNPACVLIDHKPLSLYNPALLTAMLIPASNWEYIYWEYTVSGRKRSFVPREISFILWGATRMDVINERRDFIRKHSEVWQLCQTAQLEKQGTTHFYGLCGMIRAWRSGCSDAPTAARLRVRGSMRKIRP